MSIWLAISSIACFAGAPSDVWLDIEHEGDPDSLVLHLPANWLADEADATIETTKGTVDLAAEVRALRSKRAGVERTYALLEDDGDEVPLVLRTTSETGQTTSLAIGILGPKGGGMTVSVPLAEPEAAQEALSAAIEVDGLTVQIQDPFLKQLAGSPPTVIVQTVGPKGGGLKIESR